MPTRDLHYCELVEIGQRIRKRELSPVEATQAQLDRIARLDGQLKSYAYVMASSALEQAHAAEKEIAAGKVRGPLHGVPIAVKDLCWTKDAPTAAGMTIYRDYRPSEDATVVSRLKEAGAVILGKLQLTEGAYADHHPEIDPPRNPWDATLWSGASSSGSGVATAAGLCYGSLGSDTGGSIRFPSAAKGVTAAQLSASPSKSQQIAPIDERLSNAERAIMFSIAPLTSLSAMMTPVDPDPVASFRQLIALPPGAAREAPRIDPRRIRMIVDRGVVEYASAKTEGDRARGARLIQTAALVGYPPARDLLARNYPQSEAVRSVVPAKDVIRYALVPVMAAASEDSKQIFLALGQHFAVQGQLDVFATKILELLRGDSRPQLIHRVDTLVDLLAGVPGACGALARLVPGADKAADQECSFSENLRKFIETTRPSAAEEEESKRRGLLMLNQLGER